MSMSVASLVSRLSPPAVRTTSIPRFAAGPSAIESSWETWASTSTAQSLKEFLSTRLTSSNDVPAQNKGSTPRPKVIIFGEQHHQPKVLAAQLQLVHTLATEPFNLKVTVVMEQFNLSQQNLLDDFAKTGDAEPLQEVYAKSSEGFRIDNTGYLPLLQLVKELENVNSSVAAGFPPREWARIVMRQGKQGLEQDEGVSKSGFLTSFGRWDDLNVTPEHAAYISSSISGQAPDVPKEVQQGGLKAAQAFKDAVMAWVIDKKLDENRGEEGSGGASNEVILAICGSGHCEYGFGVTERIKSCSRDQILLLVSKPDDGSYWRTEADAEGEDQEGRPLADGIIVYEAVDV
ncbi:hypothetical protein P389DRAFT_192822 [Cystobasidium minutum MCA 4210]|uniref:uncharacterized protein n=1 Tax=Cystobasidium minutum MCA 4210 TaxID=1397322 RepID=UPI0034CE566E|eukprot:jgi/Rhomi1/192822/gm1.1036_g